MQNSLGKHLPKIQRMQIRSRCEIRRAILFTWAELAEKINQVEAFLLQQGVTAQSAVAFCGKNSEQILFLYLAVIQLGAKILGINPAFPQEKREELSHVVWGGFLLSNRRYSLFSG